MNTSIGIKEKYFKLKSLFKDTNIVDDVFVARGEESAVERLYRGDKTTMAVFPISANILTDDDDIVFKIMISDKVNDAENDESVLSSIQNSMNAIRMVADRLNYQESEDVIVSEVEFGVGEKDITGNDNTITLVTAVIGMGENIPTNIYKSA